MVLNAERAAWVPTPAESVVIKTCLGTSASASEEGRIRDSGLPRATYQQAKQRLYSNGVLYDRFVPSAASLGIVGGTFVVCRQFHDRIPASVRWLESRAGCVTLWSGTQSVFAEYLHRDPEGAELLAEELRGKDAPGEVFAALYARATPREVPVYFDYEGGFRSFSGHEGMTAYPRSYPEGTVHRSFWGGEERTHPPGLEDLIRRPFEGEREPHTLGPSTLPRSQQRLLERGIVAWRTFLATAELPAADGKMITGLRWVYGRLESGSEPSQVLGRILERKVHPFLTVVSGKEVLMGVLTQRPPPTTEEPRQGSPSAPLPPAPWQGTLATLNEALSTIAETRLHRYDLLLDHRG